FKTEHFESSVEKILPEIKLAGENGGLLTEDGATLLDSSGNLEAGILMCPPEGDAGTGMVATNTVAQNTGNISAGTSAFAMVVLSNA
ncbi:ATPase, partial [Staphylococcus lugdunensis]